MLMRILKILGWVFLAALVAFTTIILIYIGRGYSYDFHTGRLKLNGLIIFSSAPSGADIASDGKSIHRKTPYRSTLETGDYSFTISKAGFRSWSKRISIAASQVTWVQYVLLVPNQLKTTTWAQTKAGLDLLATSSDHHHFAYLDKSDNSVWTIDTADQKPVKLYSQTVTPPQPPETITGLAWSDDNKELLVTTSDGSKTLQRLVNVSSGQVTKLSEQYGFDLTGLRFNPDNSKQLFWLAPEGLRRLDTDSQSVSAVLAPKVAAYSFGGNGQIIYVQATDFGKAIFVMDTSGADKRQLVESVADSPGYQLEFASYRGQDMLAVLPSVTRTITLYQQIETDTPVAKVITKSADSMKFGPDGRFLNFLSGQRLATYDLELNRTYLFAPSKTPYLYSSWFDTYHLLVANGNGLSLVEFDGGNLTDLTSKFQGILISYTANQHEILVGQPDQGPAVNLTAITIKP